MRYLPLQIVAMLMTSSLVFGSDELPSLVLIDKLEPDQSRHSGLYDDAYYLWLSVEQLARENAEWRSGIEDEQDAMFVTLESFKEFGLEDDGSLLAAVIQPGGAKRHGLKDGERIPTEKFAEICNAADFDPSEDVLLDRPPRHFGRHAKEARGGIVGRVLRIAHGFTAMLPALLLELDIEETLFMSDYSIHPYVVVLTSGYVHNGTVYCSMSEMAGWQPAVGDRLVFMPVTGPWDKDGQIMPVVDPTEVFLVEEPDGSGVSEVKPLGLKRSSVPKTLVDFRRRLWNIRDEDARLPAHKGQPRRAPSTCP